MTQTHTNLLKKGRIPETTLQCIQHLRSVLPNAKISVEVEKPGREGLTSLAEAADVIFYSRSWAEVKAFPLLSRNGTALFSPWASLSPFLSPEHLKRGQK